MTAAVARELERLGHHLDVVTMAYRDLPARDGRNGLGVHRVACLRSSPYICRFHELLSWMGPAMARARALSRAEPYDLIHAHFFLPCGVVARRLGRETGTPYVVTSHGSDVRGYNPERFRFLHQILQGAWGAVARDALAITSPSHSLATLIRRNTDYARDVEIIPNGIEPHWSEAAGDVETGKLPRILLVSRLFERKGVQTLLEALRDKPTGWEIHIVGDGPLRSRLESLAAAVPDDVTFHGWLDNDSPRLRELYRTSSILVFPSIAENFPVTLLEGMVSANAIVATGLDACREVLGDAALLVPPRAPVALRAQLDRLVADESLRRELGRKARRRALERFTWDRIGRRYHDLFTALTRRP